MDGVALGDTEASPAGVASLQWPLGGRAPAPLPRTLAPGLQLLPAGDSQEGLALAWPELGISLRVRPLGAEVGAGWGGTMLQVRKSAAACNGTHVHHTTNRVAK